MDLLRRFKLLNKQSSVCRYSQFHLIKPESVTEHVANVATLVSMMLVDLKKLGINNNLDYKKLYEAVVFHDSDETIVGDIPRTTKHSSPEVSAQFKKLEDQAMKILIKTYDLDDEVYHIWKHAKEGLEGEILKLADIASVVYKVWEEVHIYNNHEMKVVARDVGMFLDMWEESYKKTMTEYEVDSTEYSMYVYFMKYVETCQKILRKVAPDAHLEI